MSKSAFSSSCDNFAQANQKARTSACYFCTCHGPPLPARTSCQGTRSAIHGATLFLNMTPRQITRHDGRDHCWVACLVDHNLASHMCIPRMRTRPKQRLLLSTFSAILGLMSQASPNACRRKVHCDFPREEILRKFRSRKPDARIRGCGDVANTLVNLNVEPNGNVRQVLHLFQISACMICPRICPQRARCHSMSSDKRTYFVVLGLLSLFKYFKPALAFELSDCGVAKCSCWCAKLSPLIQSGHQGALPRAT